MNSVSLVLFLISILTVFLYVRERERKEKCIAKLKEKERIIREYQEVCVAYESAMAIYARREAGNR